MTKDELDRILARNPQITADGYETGFIREVYPPEPQRGTALALVPLEERTRPGEVRPVVRFIFYRARLLDADGYRGCEKDLLDGLVDAALIPGDREDQIILEPPQQVKVAHRKDEGTLIEILLP